MAVTVRSARWSLLLMLAAGCAHPAAPPAASLAQTQDGLRVSLSTVPAPPHTGDDTLLLTLTDVATGAPVGNANVTASAEALAPRLPGALVSGRAQGNGAYQVPVRLSIATRYAVQVQIERPGRAPASFTFPLEAAQ